METLSSKKKIIVMGGGTGVYTVLTGLKNQGYDLKAIVSMADDGGSSGRLREEFGVLPPGDIRRALVALSDSPSDVLAKLFDYRFKRGKGLQGHSFGNLFLTALNEISGNFSKAIKEAAQILGVKGEVIPVTLQKTRLYGRLENGKIIKGETNIDIPKHDGRLKIKNVWLEPSVRITLKARSAILAAHLIIIGPGDLYTSIIPNLLVGGVIEAIRGSRAEKVYFCNVMTKFGETNNFRAIHFLQTMEEYIGKGVIDFFIVNTQKPRASRLHRYAEKKSSLVTFNAQEFMHIKKPAIVSVKLLRSQGFLRHDPKKIAEAIKSILK